jgi:hypothetical protein
MHVQILQIYQCNIFTVQFSKLQFTTILPTKPNFQDICSVTKSNPYLHNASSGTALQEMECLLGC